MNIEHEIPEFHDGCKVTIDRDRKEVYIAFRAGKEYLLLKLNSDKDINIEAIDCSVGFVPIAIRL